MHKLHHRGSSPHTRGTHGLPGRWRPHARFIPAYAGNAVSGAARSGLGPVHPRIRGERRRCSPNILPLRGSSPHTRGTPAIRATANGRQRFIPAYAGNAGAPVMSVIITAVHPRIRGERTNRSAPARINRGSSPHTRGTLTGPRPEPPLPRFIPAYAGNACAGHQSVRDLTVHPRIRGERCMATSAPGVMIGSSPHTRGTLPTVRRLQ